MYNCGYTEILSELRNFVEALIHAVFHKHCIYPQESFVATKRFGITVKYHQKQPVIRYVQEIATLFHQLLRDKVLIALSIVVTNKVTKDTVATYHLQIEPVLYAPKLTHCDSNGLKNELAKALMRLELQTCPPENEHRALRGGHRLLHQTKIDRLAQRSIGAIVKELRRPESTPAAAYTATRPLLRLSDNDSIFSLPRHYISSIFVTTESRRQLGSVKLPVVQLFKTA
ncbi:hypothetical protein BBBOND_0108940 [Babesia bigemina]|uniref:HORMA domain-containing protein n=1 Tax=Babesia bigemina TaxID=5866 RepID=A0A061D1B0_BABBI|nr:hypothetical protein BBBOND_0108940 [Babesia bigemina]CDR94596.1 hypothetical protein BBBOND_0108940 [Babesia bigemina]|eukprot:XP_012766782.1 hypothetical protein BBBOND_0108940 [Babesia bigemina]